jgi:HEPN domain-containing protein
MQNHERWLVIAKQDLLGAKTVLKVELFSLVTYLCQQSAEKSLKAYLIFNKTKIVRTHDLNGLIELCMVSDKSFEKLYEPAKLLNPFSDKFRYPTEYDIPDFDVAQEAIKHAQRILTFVVKKVSQPETGQAEIFK